MRSAYILLVLNFLSYAYIITDEALSCYILEFSKPVNPDLTTVGKALVHIY